MLVSNIKHNGNANEGTYVVQVRYRPEDDVWYEIQDLHVNKVMPQQVAISESYMLIYEQLPPSEEEFKELGHQIDRTNVFANLPLISHQNGHSDPNEPIIQDETARGLGEGEERIQT